jgi:ABC-2 type transport system ATP-binding protein
MPRNSTTTPAVEVTGLRRSYGDTTVLDGVDLVVARGTVHALLGPNGAGKTTLVNVLATLLAPDAGTVRVDGHDLATHPGRVRAAIGLTGQFAAVDDLLTGEENLRLMGRLHHLPREEVRARTAELLSRFGLVDAAQQRPSTYSGGMRRRLDLAMGLVGRPSVLFLDEPTTGLDPRSRRAVWDVVRELVADGVSVLLTTQYLEEADQLADRITMLDGGVVVAEGTSVELKRLVPGGRVTVRFAGADDLARAARALEPQAVHHDELTLDVAGADVHTLRRLLDRLDAEHLQVEDLALHTPDLDEVFLAVTGAPRRTADPQEVPR